MEIIARTRLGMNIKDMKKMVKEKFDAVSTSYFITCRYALCVGGKNIR